MDQGAHFHKSDFQIHSCRDNQWTGIRPIIPAARLELAIKFIATCRTKGLRAVAITDHHDVCFIKYIQMAAEGITVPPANLSLFEPTPATQNPFVFPGVELTLQVPCQAIVLLDASAPVSLQETLLNALGLAPIHADEHEQGPQVQRLPFSSLKDLDERLRQNATLRDRYIILPNLNEGGGDSLLRNGFHHQYAEMPCVGGYTEKNFAGFSSGHINKLSGGDLNYGSKAVGLFQTSDSRREDSQHLACRVTWVKFAEPTAEALRQACLSFSSRLFQPTAQQSEPPMPRRYIARVEVTSSVYLGPIELFLNPQFNALIGGRGTGKSSLLEYIRWAMQDQAVEHSTEDAVDRKRQYFVDTLKEVGGIVRVYWSIDGTPHLVTYDPTKQTVQLKVAQDEERSASADEIRNLLPIRAYSQKQLSSVSGKRAELQRFVEEPIRSTLLEFERDFETLRAKIRTLHGSRRRRRDLLSQLHLQQTKLQSAQERIKSLQEGLKNLPPDADQAMKEHSARLQEKTYITGIISRVTDVLTDLKKVGRQLRPVRQSPHPVDHTPQMDVITSIEGKLDDTVGILVAAIAAAETQFGSGYGEVSLLIERWEANHAAHEAILTAAESQQEENSALLNQLKVLRDEERHATEEINRLQKEIHGIPDADAELPSIWDQWLALHSRRSTTLTAQCRALSAASNGKLEIELHAGHDIDAAIEVLESKLQGAKIHPNRWEALKVWLADGNVAVQRWNSLCQEILMLVESGASGSELVLPPALPSWELTEGMRDGVRRILSADGWLDLATLTIQDVPIFYYKGGGTKLPFERASAGQQATVLLTLLLKDDGGPLLIDQPEDDLDSEIIGDVIRDIMSAKNRRQIIFASHNANLVVNGDAELVVKFATRTTEGQTHGEIEHQGAIDCKPVREAITAVMEGGRKAFDLRRQKYGF